ncbi:hypothetical protein FJT64_026156 [Amphibalanus amphitrite]|uniref:Uncharacterized protein n=1 Tax=Amphibalanus amphitrite TaxID=1232801 RepID=A0A6A4W2S9_AMPAM|nr:hypothetical protein FJT64_026156 [Amphibalanus amphitrite]
MPCYTPVRANPMANSRCPDENCLDGRIYTRTQIGEPTGTALTSLYKISASHRDYKPPPGLRQKYPSTEGYREPWKTVLCVDQDRLGPVCPTQRSNLEPVRTPAWSESITRYDFKSPHGPATVAKRAEKQSYYQRFMADMCASAHILDRVAEFGSLGGSITQYQDDFCQRLPSQELQDRYRILVGCPPLTGNNVLSPYSTCGKSCNI